MHIMHFKNASNAYNKRCLTYIEKNIMKMNDHSSPKITNVLPHKPHLFSFLC